MNLNLKKILSDYGTILVLILLGAGFSIVTVEEQWPTGTKAARSLVRDVVSANLNKGTNALVLVRQGGDGKAFADTLTSELTTVGLNVLQTAVTQPVGARKALVSIGQSGKPLPVIVADRHMANFCNEQLPKLSVQHPSLSNARVFTPSSHKWPNFLKKDNLLNILKQISVVAIIAIGMTMIIITAGIDLSVGSLIAFSGVVTALTIQSVGGDAPTTTHLFMGAFAGIVACGLIGMFTGGMVTGFGIPAFIVTLGVMFVARGMSFILADSDPVLVRNPGFGWLGRGEGLLGLPNSVLLMGLLFILAHLLMTRTSVGRYIYAVGGNPEAARLSGVPVKWVLVFVYTLCGILAGLGGVMEASLHVTGDPKAGNMLELQVIAAVVVGGTSLAGGQGRIFGTLIGALIIGVIRNGMNLTGVEAHMQSVVYGVVILIAVLVDRLKTKIR
jgi:ribose transport system permease protein